MARVRCTNRYSSMLYHLISLNPHKDITLHVSVNNPAMVRIPSAISFLRIYAIPNSHIRIAPVQSLWVQGGRVHRGLLRGLPRPELAPVQERISIASPALVIDLQDPSISAGRQFQWTLAFFIWRVSPASDSGGLDRGVDAADVLSETVVAAVC